MHYPGTALTADHDVRSFDCGNDALNAYLAGTARQHMPKGISKTFVEAAPDNPKQVLAYFTLSMRRLVASDELPAAMAKRLPREIPGITLARLAVDRNVQGQRLGEHLLIEAMCRARDAADIVGGWGLFVDAKDSGAAAFYARYGFAPLPSNPLILVMPMASIPRL